MRRFFVQEYTLQIHFEGFRIWSCLQRVRTGNYSGLHQSEKVLIERMRTSVAGDIEQGRNLLELSFEEQVAHQGIGNLDLE